MGWRIVKQPNGRLARFSEVVDDFTDMDMTAAEAIECCREHGCDEQTVADKLTRAERDEPFRPDSGWPADGLGRWREALETVRTVHGAKVMREREAVGKGDAADG